MSVKKILVGMCILLFFCSGAPLSTAEGMTQTHPASTGMIIYVDDDNTVGPWDGTLEHPYQYIRDGIDAANNRDTVYVFAGLYREVIILGKSIHLQGEDRDTTIINTSGVANASEAMIQILADHCVLSDFTVLNNEVLYGICVGEGTRGQTHVSIIHNAIETPQFLGISIRNSSSIVIMNNTILVDDWYTSGIRIWEGSHDVMISGNIIKDSGDGIDVFGDVHSTLINTSCTITSNDICYRVNPVAIHGWNNTITNNNFRRIMPFPKDKNELIDLLLDFHLFPYSEPLQTNHWDGNYWNRPRVTPKPILGVRAFHTDVLKHNLLIFFFNFDRHPALQLHPIEN